MLFVMAERRGVWDVVLKWCVWLGAAGLAGLGGQRGGGTGEERHGNVASEFYLPYLRGVCTTYSCPNACIQTWPRT